ncbi:hypothetical protein FNV43_RR08096 [Rhamnella rubrinervis]|uniref:Uncharacterized protein n=1 Tax=Rhamnella rubrinervis TaxID=2594499 RepID=A0A8K0MNM0_9ROSA|nr:hypothetical protein FNV43_RR08096 [Rhamnella rubrinervis]
MEVEIKWQRAGNKHPEEYLPLPCLPIARNVVLDSSKEWGWPSSPVAISAPLNLIRMDFELKAGQNVEGQCTTPFVRKVKLSVLHIATYFIRLSLVFSNVILVIVVSFNNLSDGGLSVLERFASAAKRRKAGIDEEGRLGFIGLQSPWASKKDNGNRTAANVASEEFDGALICSLENKTEA